MTTVSRQQFSDPQSFRDRHNGRIDKTKRRVGILGHHIGSASKVLSLQEFNFHLAPHDRLCKGYFNVLTQMGCDEITGLRQDRQRDHHLTVSCTQERNGPIMPAIIAVAMA